MRVWATLLGHGVCSWSQVLFNRNNSVIIVIIFKLITDSSDKILLRADCSAEKALLGSGVFSLTTFATCSRCIY